MLSISLGDSVIEFSPNSYKAYPSCVICKDCSSFPSFEAALFVPRDGKLETSWVDEYTDFADTFLEDEQTRQGNILNNKTKEIGQSLILNGISPNSSENKLNKLVLSSRQFSPKVALKIEDLKAKEQLETAYAVLSGNSTALDVSSAEVIVSGQSNMPLNQTGFFEVRR
jgi:spermidine/putrescine-binding protein